MVYRAIGLMSGSSLDGLDIVFAEFHEHGGKWTYEMVAADCRKYSAEWIDKLKNSTTLNAEKYLQLHADYGHYLGNEVNQFIEEKGLHYKVALVASHGHTSFHNPSGKMTAQLGDGAAIAAATELPVVSDLRAMDIALGGQGAPIVPIGEKLLLPGYDYYLNLGGIANISANTDEYMAFDICAANQVLNELAAKFGKDYDDGGKLAATGNIDQNLFNQLSAISYYHDPFPKSLANKFSIDKVLPIIVGSGVSDADALRTYTEHIADQIKKSIEQLLVAAKKTATACKLLATGGGALNDFLVNRIRQHLLQLDIEVVVPDEQLINYKEALIMALIGVLRWREKTNSISSVTGASRNSIGGALWLGTSD